jgi:hypothetical protein
MTTLLRWPGWAHLPRDARDGVFLLGVIAWTIAPHSAHLPAWCLMLTAGVVLWRLHLAVANAPLPGRWPLIAALLLALALTWWSHRTLLGKDAGVTLLVVLMALKTLELRARRDALVVFFLGFFIVLTNFLYAQTLLVAAAMLVSVWGLLTALVLAHMPVGRPPLRARRCRWPPRRHCWARRSWWCCSCCSRAWRRCGACLRTRRPAPGLSGSLRLGAWPRLANDDSIALRVRFEGAAPPPDRLYFRGRCCRASTAASGRGCRGASRRLAVRAEPGAAAPVAYEMTIEPHRLPLLPLLEMPRPTRPDAGAADRRHHARRCARTCNGRPSGPSPSGCACAPGPGSTTARPAACRPAGPARRRRAAGRLQPAHAGLGRCAAPDRPDLVNADADAKVRRVLEHIRGAGYTYTLEPGTYGQHTVDEFWFDRKLKAFASTFLGLCGADARHGRARAHRHRLPGRRSQHRGRLLDGAPERRPRLGRSVDGRARLGARGPHQRGGARAHPGAERLQAPRGAWWPPPWAP